MVSGHILKSYHYRMCRSNYRTRGLNISINTASNGESSRAPMNLNMKPWQKRDVFGDPATGSSVPFKAKDISANIAQVIVNLNGFPIGMAGPITVKVWIEEGGKSVTDVIAYPLRVVHVE